jgi:outer membrane receptor protein involved in Fe transport
LQALACADTFVLLKKNVNSVFMQRIIIFVFFSFLSYSYCFSSTIRGKVTDTHTGEALIGASVQVEGLHKAVLSGLDGSYIIKNVPKGKFTITATSLSYAAFSKEIVISDEKEEVKLEISLTLSQKSLGEVTVTSVHSSAGSSDAGARLLEKNADNVLNILSTRTIQLAPDVTVANVLRRISGVTVDRGDDGEGRYPVIRGMDKRYNYTLINGIKIPSPDDKNRYVPMDIFPSEMLQRLEVIKALTPDMEGDAIGGVMNLVMKDAPEHFALQAQGALGYSQMLFDGPFSAYNHSYNAKSPLELHGGNYTPTYADFSKGTLTFNNKKPFPNGQLGFTTGGRFFHNKLGVLLSSSFQSTDRNSKETFFLFSPQPDPITNGSIPEFTDAQLRKYSVHEDRLGLHAKVDYRIDKNNSISFYTIFMQLNNYKSRSYTDSTSSSRTAPGLGLVKYSSYSRTNLQHIYNGTLQGKHTIADGHLLLDWSAVYSIAGQKTPDRSELILQQSFQPDSAGPVTLSGLSKIWQHNSDKDLAGYVNLHYQFQVSDQKFDIGLGGMTRHKTRDNFYNQYTFTNPDPGYVFTNVNDLPVIPNKGTPQSPNIYNTTEDISAGYGEVRWQPNARWNVLAGVRIEHTHQRYDQTALPANTLGENGVADYYDVLPSLHIKYNINPKSALHLSYFQSISRPGYFEVVPYQFPGDYYTETGNYNLHHTQAYNFDARYELFPGASNQLLIGAFYKIIQNPIEYEYARLATSNSVIMPENIGTADNVGGELVYTKYFNKFGISANYTYTHSQVSVSDKYYYRTPNTGSDTTVFVTVKRPLQGQAAHIGNISLLYKDAGSGTDLQLAAIYTGRHIVYASPYYGKDNVDAVGSGFDYWQRGNVVMDISGEQRLSKHFAFYFKLNNLLNTADIIEIMHSSSVLSSYPPFQERSDRILVNKRYYGQAYLVGLKYHI